MLNESVIKVLKNAMWDLATCADGEPNVVPVAFKDVTEDGKLVVGDVFLETTLKNRKKPGRKQVYLYFVGSKRLRRSQRLGKCRTEIQIYLYFDGVVRRSCPYGYFRLSNGRGMAFDRAAGGCGDCRRTESRGVACEWRADAVYSSPAS